MGRMKIAGAETVALNREIWSSLSTDFSSSSVDVARPRCGGRWSGLLVGPGDLALRSGTSQFYVLDRSTNGSITAIDADGELRWQTALETCGAHDLIEVSAQWGVISCYDDDSLRFIRLETGMVSMGPSLLSEADSDGIPEMDRLAFVDGEYLCRVHPEARTCRWLPSNGGGAYCSWSS